MSIRNLNFVKIDGQWYLNLPSFNGKGESLNMTDGVVELLEFLAEGREDVNVRLLRKNTTEQVKVAMARRQYIRGGAIYDILDYTGAKFHSENLGIKELWIGPIMRFVLHVFPEVINITWE